MALTETFDAQIDLMLESMGRDRDVSCSTADFDIAQFYQRELKMLQAR